MCLAVPGQVVEILDAEARTGRVDVLGTSRVVNLSLLEQAAPGDWVLVSMGFALEKLDDAEARETVQFFEELGSALERAALAAAGEEVEP
jgi:hydrogenase expression/formation protein HypC